MAWRNRGEPSVSRMVELTKNDLDQEELQCQAIRLRRFVRCGCVVDRFLCSPPRSGVHNQTLQYSLRVLILHTVLSNVLSSTFKM